MNTKCAVLLFCVCALPLLGRLVLSGRVVDEAGLLSVEQRDELENMLAAYEKSSTNQVVIVSVKSLQGKSIEDFGYELGREWGIGTKENNNGVLFIIAPNERKVRIEVGYGLEGTLTDATSKMIIERLILPAFRKGAMPQGIMDGTKAIITTLGGQTVALPDEEPETPNLVFVIAIFFILVILIMNGRASGGGPRSGYSKGPFYDQNRNGRGGGFGGRGGGGGGGSFGGGGASGSW